MDSNGVPVNSTASCSRVSASRAQVFHLLTFNKAATEDPAEDRAKEARRKAAIEHLDFDVVFEGEEDEEPTMARAGQPSDPITPPSVPGVSNDTEPQFHHLNFLGFPVYQ